MRSERQFCERLIYDMLFRWFLDLNIRGSPFDQPTFAKDRTRLLAHEVTPILRGGGERGEAAAPAVVGALQRGRDPAGGVGLPKGRPAAGRGAGTASGGRRLAEDRQVGRQLRYCGMPRDGLWAERDLADTASCPWHSLCPRHYLRRQPNGGA